MLTGDEIRLRSREETDYDFCQLLKNFHQLGDATVVAKSSSDLEISHQVHPTSRFLLAACSEVLRNAFREL